MSFKPAGFRAAADTLMASLALGLLTLLTIPGIGLRLPVTDNLG
jgi:hypothetical protein